jgi:hypothetical protein
MTIVRGSRSKEGKLREMKEKRGLARRRDFLKNAKCEALFVSIIVRDQWRQSTNEVYLRLDDYGKIRLSPKYSDPRLPLVSNLNKL